MKKIILTLSPQADAHRGHRVGLHELAYKVARFNDSEIQSSDAHSFIQEDLGVNDERIEIHQSDPSTYQIRNVNEVVYGTLTVWNLI